MPTCAAVPVAVGVVLEAAARPIRRRAQPTAPAHDARVVHGAPQRAGRADVAVVAHALRGGVARAVAAAGVGMAAGALRAAGGSSGEAAPARLARAGAVCRAGAVAAAGVAGGALARHVAPLPRPAGVAGAVPNPRAGGESRTFPSPPPAFRLEGDTTTKWQLPTVGKRATLPCWMASNKTESTWYEGAWLSWKTVI